MVSKACIFILIKTLKQLRLLMMYFFRQNYLCCYNFGCDENNNFCNLHQWWNWLFDHQFFIRQSRKM